ncbi:CG31600 [Drosophila busckii]|uniref:CG31600 n=1 Tax=Drosophila busckii TaxID=30019 RepID=A0A0M5J9F2_DROBS|nr:tetraspanin-2A [Drosophila busckii]ALC39856.1 CG31600 [Drosophila busckii]
MQNSAMHQLLKVTLALLVATTWRVIVPNLLSYDEQYFFEQLQWMVVKVYAALVGLLLLEVQLMYMGASLLQSKVNLMSWLSLPVLGLTMLGSYEFCNKYLAPLIDLEAAQRQLEAPFFDYIEHGNEAWLKLQQQLGCCGLSDPRTYLLYLRQVPAVCFDSQGQLITRGCEDVYTDHFLPLQHVAYFLGFVALALQALMFLFLLQRCLRK